MKIEIAESLVASWLRHEKGCQIVQTNWTALFCDNSIEPPPFLLDNIREAFNNNWLNELIIEKPERFYSLGIFPNQDIDTIIKQAECDVVGLNFSESCCPKLYGVDVAFHSNRLGYGDAKTNVTKIIEKSIRTALCFYNVLKVSRYHPIEVFFATPKMSKVEENVATKALEDLEKSLKNNGYTNITFKLLANQQFYKEMSKMFDHVDYSDTNELFMRSLMMLKLCGKYKSQNNVIEQDNDVMNSNDEDREGNEIKVGELAQSELRRILETIKDEDLIKKFQIVNGTNDNFGSLGNMPLLVKDRSENLARRYYAEPLIINNEAFYMCNNWKESNLSKLQDFINQHS